MNTWKTLLLGACAPLVLAACATTAPAPAPAPEAAPPPVAEAAKAKPKYGAFGFDTAATIRAVIDRRSIRSFECTDATTTSSA